MKNVNKETSNDVTLPVLLCSPFLYFLALFPFHPHPSLVAALWLSPCWAQPCLFPLPSQCPVFQVSSPSCSLESLSLIKASLPSVWFTQVQVNKQVEHSRVKMETAKSSALSHQCYVLRCPNTIESHLAGCLMCSPGRKEVKGGTFGSLPEFSLHQTACQVEGQE